MSFYQLPKQMSYLTDSGNKSIEEDDSISQKNEKKEPKLPNFKDFLYIHSQPSNFKQMILTRNSFFVDKSLLIKQVIDSTQISLILRPRGFGKSLNMSMLNTFFEHQVDIDGKVLSVQKNRALFEGRIYSLSADETIWLPPLKIANLGLKSNKYLKHQGSYPTIYVSFGKINNINYQEAKCQIAQVFLQAFSGKQFLARQQYIKYTQINQKKYKDYIKSLNAVRIKEDSIRDFYQLKSSLQKMSQLYKDFYGMDTIILIDSYDRPYQNLLKQQINQKELDDTSQLINRILSSGFKENQATKKAIATGVLDIIQVYQITRSAVDNINSMWYPKTILFFGFTKEDTEQLVKQLFKSAGDSVEFVNQLLRTIKQWYGGYEVNEVQIYNPCSVMKYLKHCFQSRKVQKGSNFWAENGGYEVLFKTFTYYFNRQSIGRLLNLIQYSPSHNNYGLYLDFTWSRLCMKSSYFQGAITHQYIVTHWLVSIGYITGYRDNDQRHHSQGKHFIARIPNYEIYDTLQTQFKLWAFQNKFFKDLSTIKIENNLSFQQKMQSTINQVIGCLRYRSDKQFKTIFSTRYLLSDMPTHKISQGAYLGLGKMYLCWQPIDNNTSAIIMDLKYVQLLSKVQQAYEDALWQVYGTRQMTRLIDRFKDQGKVKTIIVRPIIIIIDRTEQTVKIHMKQDNVHTIAEASKINQPFATSIQNLCAMKQYIQKLRQYMTVTFKFKKISLFISKLQRQIQIDQKAKQQKLTNFIKNIIKYLNLDQTVAKGLLANFLDRFATIEELLKATVESLKLIEGVEQEMVQIIVFYLQTERSINQICKKRKKEQQ